MKAIKIICRAQGRAALHLDQLLGAVADQFRAVAELDCVSAGRVRAVSRTVCRISELLAAAARLELDTTEFGLLRLLALFGSDQTSANSAHYEREVERALSQLGRHARHKTGPGTEHRLSKLLLRLPPLRAVQPDVLEEIFFGGLVSNVQIETVLPCLLTMKAEELEQYLTPS